MRGKAQLTEASHQHCYETTEVISLSGARKCGMALAEIQLADCEDGWRASHGFGFTGGDHWGSWSPIFGGSAAHPTRQEAIGAEADRLRGHIALRTGKEPDKIRTWLDALTPEQADLFGEAPAIAIEAATAGETAKKTGSTRSAKARAGTASPESPSR